MTQAGLRCTDKDDDGVITGAFIACIHSGIAAVKACIQSRNAVYTGCACLIRDVLTTVLHVATQDNDVYHSHKSYHFFFSSLPHIVDSFGR